MSQQNPIDKAEGLSSTGSTHAPLSTSSGYTSQSTGPTHGASTVTSTSTSASVSDSRSTGQKVKDLFHDDTKTNTSSTQTAGGKGTGSSTSSGVGGVFAAVHGAGEKIRGEFNAGVDRAFNEPEGEVKNANVARAGDQEIDSGHFAGSTKARELGDGGRRV